MKQIALIDNSINKCYYFCMRKLQIDKQLFEEQAERLTLKELSEKFNYSERQLKDYCRHHNIKYKLVHIFHGLSYDPLFTVWKGMIARCENEKNKDYHRYGGKGIKVCAEWHEPSKFVSWARENGWTKGLQLDRIDNNGNYEPDNCHFISPKDNMANRDNTLRFNGIPLAKLLENAETNPYNLERHTVWERLKRGWGIDKALKTPLTRIKR